VQARIRLNEVLYSLLIVVVIREEVSSCQRGGGESGVASVPLTWNECAFGFDLDVLDAIAQVPGHPGWHGTRPCDGDEGPLVVPGAIVRPILGIGISYRFEVACDKRARNEIVSKSDAEIAVGKFSKHQLDTRPSV
jgi:hypothetical protein